MASDDRADAAEIGCACAPVLGRGGERPPVMLIHGVGADGTSWDQIAPALSPEFRVLRLDLRGHGRSGHIDGALTLDDFVRDVVDVLDACAVPAAHIVGFLAGRHDRAGHRVAACGPGAPAGVAQRGGGPHARKSASGCRRGLPSCGNKASRRSPGRRRSVGSRRSSSRAIPTWCAPDAAVAGEPRARPTRPRTRCSRRATWASSCTRSVSRR